MNRALMVIVVVLGVAGTAFAQETVDIKGGWNMLIETPNGEIPISLKFDTAEGEKISGTLFSPQGDLPVSGNLKGKELTFSGTFQGPNGNITLTFTGAVESDSITGTADFGGRGSGKWSAKRAK